MKTNGFILNLIIAGAFIAIGLLSPGSSLTSVEGFSANITGIATGIGLGWLIKTLIESKKGAIKVE